MKTLAAIFILLATPAFAHLGHLGEVAGHGHWIAAGAVAGAAVAAWLAGKGKKAEADPELENEKDEDDVGVEA